MMFGCLLKRVSRLAIKTCQSSDSLRAWVPGRPSAHPGHSFSLERQSAAYHCGALSLITKVSRRTKLNCKLQFRFDIRAVTAWRYLLSLIRCYIRPASIPRGFITCLACQDKQGITRWWRQSDLFNPGNSRPPYPTPACTLANIPSDNPLPPPPSLCFGRTMSHERKDAIIFRRRGR